MDGNMCHDPSTGRRKNQQFSVLPKMFTKVTTPLPVEGKINSPFQQPALRLCLRNGFREPPQNRGRFAEKQAG